ncbi:ABC transporter ATP-binding protein [Alkalibacterium sp. MB6]|uniref:ABC transporter ATP-binding protein n=1 Tax=Alkalibacterium sp. MB6 TaxID=2081965 RepID=UPI00137AB388|nr:ATP-binding cassette domain-containing protein [Alkalibacterium sp. MB6]
MTDLIRLDNIGFKTEQQQILKDISFSIKEGERVIVTGPSGGGKSTLLKLIASIINPIDGQIYFKGEDIAQLDPIAYRKKVSYFFQNATLFDETVRDNLSFPYNIREEAFDEGKAVQMLDRVKMSAEYLNKPIIDLSGGEKQRVALVRNLLYQPDVLLLDEVTSSLDAENKEIIYSIIDEMNTKESVTVLAVTHDEREFKMADRVLTIIEGRLEDSK